MKKETPDLMGAMPKPRRGRPPKSQFTPPPRTAEQIAASCEAEGKKWLNIAKELRGKAK